MPEDAVVVKTKTAIANLLSNLGIEKVICVDDFYARKWNAEDVQAAQRELSTEQLISLVPELRHVPRDMDVRREKFRLAWNQMDPTVQAELAEKIMMMVPSTPAGGEDDARAASTLRELIGKEHLTELAPADWEKKEAQVLDEAADSGILVLFDQDLTEAGGSATGGMAIVKNVLAKDTSGKLLCGLLTHTATTRNQQEQWERYANETGVERDRFVLVAKGWLTEDPLGFARMLKLVALAPDCNRMKEKAKTILDSVNAEAAQGIEGLSVFDFDHIVFRESQAEGIWEADMLFRLHAIFHRPALREKACGDGELNEIIGRLRKVSLIPTHLEGTNAAEQTSWKLQQQEMYEAGDYINRLHLPIEVGDIFEKTDGVSKKAFILLGQPCDLMVRSAGKREPKVSDVLLAEVIQRDPHENRRPEYANVIKYYGDDRHAEYYVKFRRTHFVDPCVLDLCVFHEDGVSRMDLAVACPDGLVPAWTNRFAVLKKRIEAILRQYEKFGENKPKEKAKEEMLRAAKLFPPVIGNSRLFRAAVEFGEDGGRIRFNCRRVRRLCRPRALALTLQYAACFSRPAFDRELG